MENTEIVEKMVSIIVPVYNAEKYLGYCLNAIVSQSYRQLEIILVNDGSTDNSLQICQNYANIDDRVKVISIQNGGVSNARNVGLDAARGEYVQFVDSDDVIDLSMTEKMLIQMETYNADIVFCGMEIVDVDENYTHGVVREVFSSRKIGKECVLRENEFYKEFPRLLFDTVLMEGPCNRIYKNSIIRDYDIRFPVDISLGEDFIFNLKYYEIGKIFVLMSEELYFYIHMNINSLSRIYRKDLLENKIRLLEAYSDFLDRMEAWTPEGEIWYADYCIGYFINVLSELFLHSNMLTVSEVKAQIEKIINHKIFRHNINKAGWISEQWVWIKDYVRYSDVGMIYDKGMKMITM